MAACSSEKISVNYIIIYRIELILSTNFDPGYLLGGKNDIVNQLHSILIV